MSRKETIAFSKYRDSGFKAENEPEEGEIVDEYDLIVSSDEELCMRRRIRELEAENEEIEQIAVISRSYADKLNPFPNCLESNRAAQVPTDVSSISSTEFVTPKKRTRGKNREHKRRHCHHQHQRQHHHQHQYQHTRHDQQEKLPLKLRPKKTHCKRRQKLFGKNNKKLHSDQYMYKEINAEAISKESVESSDSLSSLTDTDNYGKQYLSMSRKASLYDTETYITRDTLRMAIARNLNDSKQKHKKPCLKDKLLKIENVSNYTHKDEIRDTRHFNINEGNDQDNDDDDDVQVIETEPYIHTVDEDSSDSMEEKELRLIALKSAVLKKHMARKIRNAEAAYSPTDFDDMLSSGILQQNQNLDDLEIVDLEEDEDSQNACAIVSPEASPQLKMLDEKEESQQMVDCKPVDMDISNSDSEDTTIGSWPKEVETSQPSNPLMPQNFTNHFQYNFFMHDIHELSSRPPPPPGVDDYVHTSPPPLYHHFHNSEMQDMELENEEFTEVNHHTQSNSNELPSYKTDICSKEDTDVEEEEEALRALLLSKFQSPKNQKKSKKNQSPEEHRNITKELEATENPGNNIKQTKPTEFILKEAVKRLKIHSQIDNLKDTDAAVHIDKYRKCSPKKMIESKENNADSSFLLVTLRNRLLKYTDQNRTIEHEERFEDKPEFLKEERESFAPKFNDQEYMLKSESLHPNNMQVSSTVDISDITRRLQKIKEDVLNATKRQLPSKEDKTNEDIKLPIVNTYHIEEQKKLHLENVNTIYQPIHNNIDKGNASTANNVDDVIVNEKIVKVNFDDNTKQTTLKVTIKNDDHFKAGDKDINVTNNGTPLEENNVSKNKLALNSNANTNSKTSIIAHKPSVNHNKSVETKIESKPPFISLHKPTLIVPAVKTAQTSSAGTNFSMLRTTKIIKPNKIINTNVELKRKEFSQNNDITSMSKMPRQEQSTESMNIVDNARLITSIDQVKHMCKVAPFIISVQNSSAENSEDELADCDSLYRSLYDYNDNASPLSLNLESPSSTPLRSNSPTDLGFTAQSNTDSDKNLDQKVNKENLNTTTSTNNNTTKSDDLNQVNKTNKTPLAVRHLPAAAQKEYRRLVHRMMLLENKRKTTILDEGKHTELETKNENDTEPTNKTSLVKKVLIRNANNNNTTLTNLSEAKTSTELVKVHKTNVLRSYENLFVKIGAGIVNNLDKSLKLVEEAKMAKISKLKLENRIKELKAEMEVLQRKHKEEQQKISHIYPSICTTNEVITSLKQKRSNVFKAAINLGKNLKGEDYRLNNDLKERINSKSKQLATEIKIINSLKIQDLTNLENTPKQSVIKETADNKENLEENNKNVYMPETTAKSIVKENTKETEETEETKCNNPLSQTSTDIQYSGNTEFQEMVVPNMHNENTNQNGNECSQEKCDNPNDCEDKKNAKHNNSLPLYISPLEHLRNLSSNIDPNGIICPYDLMGNCEDVNCKYVHITSEAET